jgi:hypothetical protein
MQWLSAADHMSGNPGSTVPVGYGSTSNSFPSRIGAARLLGQAEHRLLVEREAARVLVEADGQARRAPVRVQAAHVALDGLGAQVQLAGVADALLALEHLGEVALLAGRAERDVARRVVVQRFGVGLPDLHAGGHELGHRGLEVVVAHDPAGDARGAGGDAGLVDDEDLLAVLGEVPGGGEAVDPGADDQVLGGGGEHQCAGGSQPSRTGRV